MDLIEARVKKRVTQWDVAIATGICQSKVSLIERGYVYPNENEKSSIIAALGFDKGDIEWANRKREKV